MTQDGHLHVQRLLEDAVAARVTPGAIVEAGTAIGASWTATAGRISRAADAAPVTPATLYDLASLTKVLATTTLAMRHHTSGALPLKTCVADRLPGFERHPRMTVADLLQHAAGLPAHRPYYREVAGRAGYLARIAAEPLSYAPGARHEYTDLGFILLGLMIEDTGAGSLAQQFDTFVSETLNGIEMGFGVCEAWRGRAAPTTVSSWREHMLVGRVHDDNAAALGGAAGHAGLFGTAAAVGAVARWFLSLWTGRVLASAGIAAATASTFATRGTVPGSSRALGWDTMLPTSSCGSHLSARAVGHTGYTGTSLWIDPELDLYVVCLTNRVHCASDGDGVKALRIAVHDAIAGPARRSGPRALAD